MIIFELLYVVFILWLLSVGMSAGIHIIIGSEQAETIDDFLIRTNIFYVLYWVVKDYRVLIEEKKSF